VNQGSLAKGDVINPAQFGLLILAQLVYKVLRRDARLREWFKRIKRRRGATIARVAVMRKLATIIWYMLSKKMTYAECRARVAA